MAAFLLRMLSVVLGVALAASTYAQSYPSKPITYISVVAGGAAEAYMRAVLDKVRDNTGATLVYEPRPGGGGAPALQALKRSAPDGYSYGITFSSASTLTPLINKELDISVLRDFIPVSNLTGFAVAIMTREDFPAKDLRDMVAMAKAKPGSIRIATFGTANTITLALILERSGVKLESVPYKTTAEAITATLGGHIEGYFDTVSGVIAQKGKAKPVAYLGPTAIPQLPGVPLTRELYNFDLMNWFGVLAPAGTPAAATGWMQRELIRAVRDPAVRERLESAGYTVLGHTGQEFERTLRGELEQNAAILSKYPDIR